MGSPVFHQWDFALSLNDLVLSADGRHLAASLGDGSVRILPAHDAALAADSVQVHDGVALSFVPDADAHAFLSGGDDGRVCLIEPHINTTTEIAHRPGAWIDHVAATAAQSRRAYAFGKKVVVLAADGTEMASIDLPGAVGGLAFRPDGLCLAASHYNGVTLLYLDDAGACLSTDLLPWKGSHLDLCWSPDGTILISALQDSALHGWRIADKEEMHMHGYQARVRDMVFTPDGRYLATSGADQAILWPFFDGGPWEKRPLVLGGTDIRLVRRCAPHPQQPLVAIGYDDGMIVLAPLDGRLDVMIHGPRPAADRAGIAGLCWSPDGLCLFAGLDSGRLLLFTQKSILAAR